MSKTTMQDQYKKTNQNLLREYFHSTPPKKFTPALIN